MLIVKVYGLTYICLWIDLHLWHTVIVLHISFTDIPTILHSLYPLTQIVGGDCSSLDRSFGDEGHGGAGNESLEEGWSVFQSNATGKACCSQRT